MTTAAQWHAGPDLLQQYAAGRLDPVAQATVEAHVERCASCRADTAALVAPDPPRSGLGPSAGRDPHAGARPAAPGCCGGCTSPRSTSSSCAPRPTSWSRWRSPWLPPSAFALVAAQLSHDRQQLAWLTIAPLLPALLVAGAYDSTDPIRELADATPYSKLRVALLRTLVAILGAVPLVVVMGLVPEIDISVAAWLLPALAIACVLLVLLTRLSAAVSVAAVAAGWVLGVAALRAGDQIDQVTAPLGQSLSFLVAVASALVLARRWGLLRPERTRA